MIEAVIFDWAGTTVDFGSMAPVESFAQAFREHKIEVTNDEIRKPMGMLKVDHIKSMLAMSRIYDAFIDAFGRSYEESDIQRIYCAFEKHLLANIAKFTEVKPYVLEVVRELRLMGLKIGSTTGYTDAMMETVVKDAKRQGYSPDAWFSPDSVHGKGRPQPFMIYKNMEVLEIQDVRKIIKVGDTIADIEEGIHAGVYSVGIIEGSSLMGYALDEYEALNDNEKQKAIFACEEAYRKAGADTCIMNLSELPALIKNRNKVLV